MIYIKNNTEIQTIFIPRNELQKEAYIASTKTYEDGYRDGLEDGKEQQKDKLLNLYVTENGQYEREDGWGVVTVDTPDCPEGGSCNLGEGNFVFGTSDVGRYELNASDDGYDGWSKIYLEIEGRAIKVHRAADLLDSFNNDNGAGLDYGFNYYVGGEITEVQEISTQYGNATYILDNGFKIYRGKWIDGNPFDSEDQIKVGAYIVVYGVLAEYKGTLQLNKNSQVIAYQECEETDCSGAYNEGYEQGKTDGVNEQKGKLESINITENGTYSIDDQETIRSIAFDGYSYFNTGIFPTENIKIEACIKITNGNNSGLGGIIIGGGIGKLGKNTKSRGIAIGMDGGGIYGIWGAIKSRNKPYKLEGEGTTTVVLQKTDDSWVWDGEKGSFGASGLYIGGYNSDDIEVEKKFLQSIVYIKIWTNKDDDSTLITYTPKTNGNFDANGIELQRLGDGTTTFVKENVIKYPYGFKRVEVNVPDLNGSYNEGYEQGKEDAAANARILNVTENGTYLSKFSDPILPTVTGVYDDGTNFYNYAYLNNIQYNTNIYPMSNTKMEIWWKYDGSKEGNEGCIIGCQNWGYINSIFKIGWNFGDNRLLASINDDTIFIPFIEGWNHIVMSYADGLWLNGVKIGDFPSNITDDMDKKEPICINGYYGNRRMNSDYFGMVKINDVVIIPTAEGFKNVNTGELLEVVKDGTYTFTENEPIYGEGELYKTINVNVPDLNGSYDEGKTDGINEQKSKLESINITENGTYNREDGYNKIIVKVPDLNGSYDEGYDQGQADIAENAIVLNVTENGVYKTKFSDPIMPTTVTGVYADGTEFYNYAQLEGISYDSGFIVSEDMKVEIWWKGDVSKIDKNLFGSQVNNNYAIFKIRIPDFAYRFDGEIAMRQVTYLNAESNRWYHFKMSYADGFWVDGVKIGDFSSNISGTPDKLYINSNTPYLFNGANGYFGMIKITTNGVENIIIPTAEGLKNITTNERLQVVQNGSYTFTKNLPTYGEGEIYKTINVNVPTVQEQITDYYYCPITVTDSGFGDKAKSFLVKNENMYGENGWINDDSFVYLPTANNMNEVRTKTPPSSVASFPFDDNAAHYTGALYMNVEQIQMNNVVLPNLYKLELGSGCHTLRMESSNLPNINTLIIRYNGQQLFDYHFSLTQFKNGGKLYVYEGLGNAENLRAALGSEWTIEYL